MQLIGSYTSPFVRKIRIILLEKRLHFSFIEESPWLPDSRVIAHNPLSQVPVLVDERGEDWYDSRVIEHYLESLDTRPRLIPVNGRAAAEVLRIEALCDGALEAGIAIFLERKREPALQDAQKIERSQKKLQRGLAALDRLCMQGKSAGQGFLHVSGYSVADVAAGCTLDWLDFRLSELDWPGQYPELAAMLRHLNNRAAFRETIPME